MLLKNDPNVMIDCCETRQYIHPHKRTASPTYSHKRFIGREDDEEGLVSQELGIIVCLELRDIETVFAGGLAHYRRGNRIAPLMITPAVRLDRLAEGHFYLELEGRPGRILEGARPARNFGEIAYKACDELDVVRKFGRYK